MQVFMRCGVQAADELTGLQARFGGLQPDGSDYYTLCDSFAGSTLQLPADQRVVLVPRGDVVLITGFVVEADGPADVWLGDPTASGPHLQLRPMRTQARELARVLATATVPQVALRAAVAGQRVTASCGIWGGRPEA